MTDIQTARLVELITSHTGIKLTPVYTNYVCEYVESRLMSLEIGFDEYIIQLDPGSREFNSLIPQITTNETYFFREEREFHLLKEFLFPFYAGRQMVIWSAACSSGEEPVSLYALAASCGVIPKVYASDIDLKQLELFKKGFYGLTSFRRDGQTYKHLLEEIGCGEYVGDGFQLSQEFLSKLNITDYNLTSTLAPPTKEPVDLVFLRNVFLYFDEETRKSILKKISEILSPSGIIFLSLSEIGSIVSSLIPETMEKINVGSLNFLAKKSFMKEIQLPVMGKISTPQIKASAIIPKKESSVVSSSTVPREQPKPMDKLLALTAKASEIEKNAVAKNIVTPKNTSSVTVPLSLEKKIGEKQRKPVSYILNNYNASKKVHLEDPETAFKKIKSLIKNGNHAAAKSFAYSFSPTGDKKVFGEFFRGYTEKASNNIAQAELHYKIAKTMAPDFWPVHFYYGMLLKEQSRDEEAKESFKICLGLLDEYNQKGSTELDFLTETFTTDYYYIICMKYMR
ncbi:MAG: hypothetical protein J6B81_01470 [Spirochaetaceae bacterium]|nr:hypothetical protein [Spirochaetaceae bacterium]